MEIFNGSRREPHTCPYYSTLQAAPETALISAQLSEETVDRFLEEGWRHFGPVFFRDNCPDCDLCRSLRVAAQQRAFRKSHRRLLRKNNSLSFRTVSHTEYLNRWLIQGWELYNRHQIEKFRQKPLPLEQYAVQFLSGSVPGRVSLCFDREELIGVGFLDVGRDAVSTVYFSYDPAYSRSSPGIWSILKEMEWAAENGKQWYYLGYWLADHPSMDYKSQFMPGQMMQFSDGRWRTWSTRNG